jgi:hypothetical protein
MSQQRVAAEANESLTAAARIRDRYIFTRFPGVARTGADLADTRAVIKAARLYFEDGLAARGVELLQLAAQMDPACESLWLARLQLHFLLRDAPGFTDAASRMREFHASSPQWPRIAALGVNLGLAREFAAEAGANAGHAGDVAAWPELPDWLQSPGDQVPMVVAAQMRSRILAATDSPATPHESKESA